MVGLTQLLADHGFDQDSTVLFSLEIELISLGQYCKSTC